MLFFAACLAFLSGFVALGYEILWARRLADVIGATSLAASLVVGVFFVMLAWGAIALGPLAARTRSPWRLYAILEGGILAAILPAFWGDALAAQLAPAFGDALFRPGVGLFVKTLLAWALGGLGARFDLNQAAGRLASGAVLSVAGRVLEAGILRLLDRASGPLDPVGLLVRAVTGGLLVVVVFAILNRVRGKEALQRRAG